MVLSYVRVRGSERASEYHTIYNSITTGGSTLFDVSTAGIADIARCVTCRQCKA